MRGLGALSQVIVFALLIATTFLTSIAAGQTPPRVGERPSTSLSPALKTTAVIAATGGPHPLRLTPEVLSAAPTELLDRLRADPYSYFRLINREWTARVCDVFAADLTHQPVVHLHGDAHVEQFAYTTDTWGLDDFDDSTRGPALVDIVRFLGSIDLVTRSRGWSSDRERLFDRFFQGYRDGLSDPDARSPEPDVVRRQKVEVPTMTRPAFLAWAESMMEPISEAQMNGLVAAMKGFSEVVRAKRTELRDDYFRVVRAGRLRMGVGSAEALKLLIRVEGPSIDPDDDVLIEAKAVRSRGPLPCLDEPKRRPTMRIVQGTQLIGRLPHDVLVAGPDPLIPGMTILGLQLRQWWIQSWDPSYHEIGRADLQSVSELAEIVYDSGLQLGASTIHGVAPADVAALRTRLSASIDHGDARMRAVARSLVEDLLEGWHDIRGDRGHPYRAPREARRFDTGTTCMPSARIRACQRDPAAADTH